MTSGGVTRSGRGHDVRSRKDGGCSSLPLARATARPQGVGHTHFDPADHGPMAASRPREAVPAEDERSISSRLAVRETYSPE